MIVKEAEGDRFVRLVYSPFDFGFDAPPAKESQLLPRQMTTDKGRLWAFQIHPPLGDEERGPCTPPPRKIMGGNGKPIFPYAHVFSYVAGDETVELPPVESLSCFVVEAWSEAKKGLNTR
jgi:hypothetical protein